MILIVILIALGLDFFLTRIESFRNTHWFISLYYWMEKRFAHMAFWNGPIGLIAVLLIPIVGLLVLQLICDRGSWMLETVFILLVLVYCLAPKNLNSRLDQYIKATADDAEAKPDPILIDNLVNTAIVDEKDTPELSIIKSTFIDAHQRTFAVIFWFFVLGVVGAFLYRLVAVLQKELNSIHGEFSDSINRLLDILEWPSSRLMAIGLALAGSLVSALDGWRHSESVSFKVNRDVLINSGLGSLQYRPDINIPEYTQSYWISALKDLLNRTLTIWLVMLAAITLTGTLG